MYTTQKTRLWKTYRCYGAIVCPVCVYNIGVLWPNSWMDQDATWYGGRPRPSDTVSRGSML